MDNLPQKLPLSAITDAMQTKFHRPHMRSWDVWDYYEAAIIDCCTDICFMRENLVQRICYNFSDWKFNIDLPATLSYRRTEPHVTFDMMDKMPEYECTRGMVRGAKFRDWMLKEQPIFATPFRIPLSTVSKEDVIALLLDKQITLMTIMLDEAAQERELEAETGEPESANGIIRENNLIVISPSISGESSPPIVAQPSQIRFELVGNAINNLKIIHLHTTHAMDELAQIYTEKHKIQAMHYKLVFDRSIRALSTMSAAKWCKAVGVDENKSLNAETGRELLKNRDKSSIPCNTLEEMLAEAAKLARKFNGVKSTAYVRYLIVSEELSESSAARYSSWTRNELAKTYFRDHKVPDSYEEEAKGMNEQYVDNIIRPLMNKDEDEEKDEEA